MPRSLPSRPGLCRAVLLVAIALALGGIAAPAIAQPPPAEGKPTSGDKKLARKHLARGDKLLQRGDRLVARGKIEQAFSRFEAALREYLAAHEAFPDPQIYFPIAQAEQRLGRFLDALQHYQELLADSSSLRPELRSKVQVHLDEVRKNLAAVVIEVEPEGATISIDGEERASSPMSQPLFIEPGQHGYEVTRRGYRPARGVLDLPPGKETRKRIQLERAGPGDVEVARPRVRDRRTARRKVAPPSESAAQPPSALPVWIGIGLTGALALSGAGTGIAAFSKHNQYEDQARQLPAREKARTDGKRLAGITDVLLGASLVSAGVTATYYFAVYRPRAARADQPDAHDARGAERQAGLRLAPVLGDGVAGLAVSGTFW